MARKRRAAKAIDAGELEKILSDPDTKDALDKMLTCGLKLKLETARRKNPYFKGSRRGSEHMKLSREREYKRAAQRFASHMVKMYFINERNFVSPN
jgi:hypothetical protein